MTDSDSKFFKIQFFQKDKSPTRGLSSDDFSIDTMFSYKQPLSFIHYTNTQQSTPMHCLFKKRLCYHISYHFPPSNLSLTSYTLLLYNHFYALKTLSFCEHICPIVQLVHLAIFAALSVILANFLPSQLEDYLVLSRVLS